MIIGGEIEYGHCLADALETKWLEILHFVCVCVKLLINDSIFVIVIVKAPLLTFEFRSCIKVS